MAELKTIPTFEVFTAFCLQFFGPSSHLPGSSTSQMFAPLIVADGTSATFYSNISKGSSDACCFRQQAFERCCGSLSLLSGHRRFDSGLTTCRCRCFRLRLRACHAGNARKCYWAGLEWDLVGCYSYYCWPCYWAEQPNCGPVSWGHGPTARSPCRLASTGSSWTDFVRRSGRISDSNSNPCCCGTRWRTFVAEARWKSIYSSNSKGSRACIIGCSTFGFFGDQSAWEAGPSQWIDRLIFSGSLTYWWSDSHRASRMIPCTGLFHTGPKMHSLGQSPRWVS